jgi:hypothetical protein
MSTPDETHHEPGAIHDETAAKTGAHPHDEHGHDAHGHEAAADFIPETSLQDNVLKLVTILTGAGLIMMMFIWWSTPIEESAGAQHSPHAMNWEFKQGEH